MAAASILNHSAALVLTTTVIMAATLSLIVRNLLSVSKPGKGSSLKSTLYLSVDIEADGPIPGPYSMLSIGAVAITIDGKIVGTFSANLAPLPQASQHPETMQFILRAQPRTHHLEN